MNEDLKQLIEKHEKERFHGELVLNFKDGQVPNVHEKKIIVFKKEEKPVNFTGES